MIWKTLFVACLAIGVLGEYQLSDDQRQQFKEMIKQQCQKAGAADQTDQAENALKNFIDCGKNLIDADTVKKEIEEAKPRGALDEVFKKYCAKTPELKTCLHTLYEGVTPCLGDEVRSHLTAINNGTDQLLDFICFKDGDRIALFIAEGGPECFQSKANEIRECAMKLKEGVATVEQAKALSAAEQCKKFDDLKTCVVTALERCTSVTPGNMADALFRFVVKGTPCEKK